jgi:hypothetical protein
MAREQGPFDRQKLRSGIPPIYRMDEHVATLTQIYRDLLVGAGSSRG